MTTHSSQTTTSAQSAPRGRHRAFSGVVVRVSSAKTIRVLVKRVKMHPKYRKQYQRSRLYAVHDEEGKARAGQTVRFVECRPLSKTKRWRLTGTL